MTARRAGSRSADRDASLRGLQALLRARIDGVNEAIIQAAVVQPAFRGMGTTLAMLLFVDGVAVTLHLGDSRIYRMRDDVLGLLTRDHSLLQEQIDAGVLTPAEARDSINRNFVTRALGVDTIADPEINEYDLMPGDLFLICSDGLPDMLSDEEIFDLLRGTECDGESSVPTSGRDDGDDDRGDDEFVPDPVVVEADRLNETAVKLIAAANARGGRDNVSVVLASAGWARAPERPGDALVDGSSESRAS